MNKQFYVYILTNNTNTTLYIGITNDLIRRIHEHKHKLVPGFTKRYNLSKLVFYEQYSDSVTAINREKSLKNLLRRKKENLISSMNPEWLDLYPLIV